MKTCRAIILGAAALLLAAGCTDWQYDVTLHGIAFEKARVGHSGVVIGRIRTDTVVHERPCRQGWLHLHSNGMPAAYAAAREVDLPRLRIPPGTWVFQDEDGVVTVCAFPSDTEVQGHLCRGSGGPKGVQTAFHPSGALKQFYPVREIRIDGVPCDTGLVRGWIELHENGRLASCVLSEDFERDGWSHRKGSRISLAPDGRIQR